MMMKKEYTQLEVVDVVRLIPQAELDTCVNSDQLYTLISRRADKLTDHLLEEYEEVGELDYTELSDFCDNFFYKKGSR